MKPMERKSLEGIAVGEVIDLTVSKGGPQEGVDETQDQGKVTAQLLIGKEPKYTTVEFYLDFRAFRPRASIKFINYYSYITQ